MISELTLKRAKILRERGHTLISIAKQLGITECSELVKYQAQENWEQAVPTFTFQDFLDDASNILFRYLTQLNLDDKIDHSRTSTNLRNYATVLREFVALASMSSAKCAIENDERLMRKIAEEYDPEIARPILQVLQADYDEAMSTFLEDKRDNHSDKRALESLRGATIEKRKEIPTEAEIVE